MTSLIIYIRCRIMVAWAMIAAATAMATAVKSLQRWLHQFRLWAKVARCQNGFYRCKIHFSTIRKLNLPFLFIWVSRHRSNIGSATRRSFFFVSRLPFPPSPLHYLRFSLWERVFVCVRSSSTTTAFLLLLLSFIARTIITVQSTNSTLFL